LLNERSAGVAEIAERLDLSQSVAAEHLDKMLAEGLVEITGEVLNRGKVEPRYRAAVPVIWSDEELADLSLAERRRLLTWVTQTVNGDVDEALTSGTFVARDDAHASRTILQVDEQGWEELVRIHAEALDAVFDIKAASAERLAEAKLEGISALSAVFCCELPPRTGATKAPD
jgi:DNA-binding transcriptional ArsR family regulator